MEILRHRSWVPTLILALAGLGATAARAGEAERLVEVLRLEPGLTAADVGAGDGEWSLVLAQAVGPGGTVYATEVEDDLVARLGRLGLDRFLPNLVAVRGDAHATGLAPGCCDAILLRMVYHHFTDPQAMREGIFAALRPGGRIAVVDIAPQAGWRELEGVPERGGHGIPADDLAAEMVGAGFELESSHRDWRSDDPDRYCLVFRKPAAMR